MKKQNFSSSIESEEFYDEIEKIREDGVLRAVVDYNSTNYFVYRGLPMGFQYELLTKLAKKLEVSLQIVVSSSIEESFELLNSGRVHIIARNLTITKERKDRVRFTYPFVTTRQVLVQRKLDERDSTRQMVRNQLDLAGKSIYVQKETSYWNRIKHLSDEIGADIPMVTDSIYGTEQLIAMVANGEIDYTVCDEIVAQVNKNYFSNLDVETPISFPQQLAWAVGKNSKPLGDYLDRWIKEFKKTREYDWIFRKYYRNDRYIQRMNSIYFSLNNDKLSPYDEIIKRRSGNIGWDWRLVASIVYQESNFSPKVKSWAGAMGLMQLMPATARRFKVKDVYSPEENIRGGTELLEWLDEYFLEEIPDRDERTNFVLASYNAGLGHILDARRLAKKYGKDPNIWKDNVDFYLLNKSQSKYYKDPVVKWGYCRGREPYNYVIQITDRYQHYQNLVQA